MKNVKIFGILNVTPDSFSDGGKYLDPMTALRHAQELLEEDVDFIDVGGESTRPGAEETSPEQEWERDFPIFKSFVRNYSTAYFDRYISSRNGGEIFGTRWENFERCFRVPKSVDARSGGKISATLHCESLSRKNCRRSA